MKPELSPELRKELEDFLTALIEYHLEGRLMLFQGLTSHEQMSGAINITSSLVGYKRFEEIAAEVVGRPEKHADQWKGRGWKYKDLAGCYREFSNPQHVCGYCRFGIEYDYKQHNLPLPEWATKQ